MVALLNYRISDIAALTEGEFSGDGDISFHSILTDSRKYNASASPLFIAIKGIHHDGHAYISELFNKGVRAFLIESDIDTSEFKQAAFIKVEDSISALQLLAKHHRNRFSYPLIAITGSNGKTIVKEWLYTFLKKSHRVIRSPKSYNSQLGVPLSVMNMTEEYDIAILEAGISQKGEMKKLSAVLSPDICLFTNLGSAHNQGFRDTSEKLKEKLCITTDASLLLAYAESEAQAKEILSYNMAADSLLWSYERLENTDIHIEHREGRIVFSFRSKEYTFNLPFKDAASIQNVIHCILMALHLEEEEADIKAAIEELQPVAMRLEMKAGLNNTTLINDTYNADLEGIYSAIDFLKAQTETESYTVILSDLLESTMDQNSTYQKIVDHCIKKSIHRLITVGEAWSQADLDIKNIVYVNFPSVEDLIHNLEELDLKNEGILIKGARKFQLEKLSKLLEKQQHKTILEINLDAFTHNLAYYKQLIHSDTKIMVMVKAFSYGSGAYEIAKLLEYQKVDYLTVAYTDEGVRLREAGIQTAIMVMNPQEHEFHRLRTYHLEPEIYSNRILREWISFSSIHTELPPIHLKINTGMNRLGFSIDELEMLSTLINENDIKVATVFSHLAASDDETKKDFTQNQINTFKKAASIIEASIGGSLIKHILNSAGIENHLEHQLDMVRLGIGLYGIGSPELQTVSTFKSFISQIRTVAKGDIIGYGADNPVKEEKLIAIVNAGYSDGLDRRLSNGIGEVLVNGQRAPIIGRVCMDMTMVDITHIDSVPEGEEVILFNSELTVTEIAQKIGSIPYEVLTGISQRIPRIYYKE